MSKLTSLTIALIFFQGLFAQEQEIDKVRFSGGFESNTQWYQDDSGLGTIAPPDQLRSNNYFFLRADYGRFRAGVQYEVFAPSPLLGYFPGYAGNGVGTYFLQFEYKDLELTGGNFYDQFGSGLIYRSWEDRQLGIDNSIRGVRVKYDFTPYWDITGFTGNQREAFEISDGTITGLNSDLDLGLILESETDLRFGASYVSRYQDSGSPDPDFPSTVGAYSVRGDVGFDSFYLGAEFVYKEPDAFVQDGNVQDGNYNDGKALLINSGYTQKGLGINTTLRAIENMGFYSDREAAGNPFLLNTINFVPGYTKQQDYAVTNVYVYAPQPGLNLDEDVVGEIGGQIDVYYTIPKDTWLGGKYGTKLELNYANWHGLENTIDRTDNTYETDLFSWGQKYFEEYSIGVKKRFFKRLSAIFTGVHTEYNGRVIEGNDFFLRGNSFVLDVLYKLNNGRSMRADIQHLETEADRGNWAAATFEYAFSPFLAFYVTDLYNYDATDIHYYSVGGSYTRGRTRVAFNYGRQRGGLVCVGGVCRFVPENTGLTLNISTNF